MANPWLKKNPFMSMWLSGMNAAAGSLRGRASTQARRQATTAMTKASRDIVDFWAAGFITPTKTRKRNRKRP